MGKIYEKPLYGLFEPSSTDDLTLDDQQDLFFAQLGNDEQGIIKAVELEVLSLDLVLHRVLESVQKHNQQQKNPLNARSGPTPILKRIETLAGLCIEIKEGKVQPNGSQYPAGARDLLLIQLGALIELANRREVLVDGLKQLEATQKRTEALHEINAAKDAAIKQAQEIAKGLWEADTAETIRIGQMADMVYRTLHGLGMTDVLPEEPDTLKDWIKSVAPDYARKPGKPKKVRRP
ncbi:hypothetical protein [Pseudomonas lini]|uniref:Uncharacterized protein n=1 Tax=Pseudomonas lini TaxID=163011 RepID=A0A423IJM3_9PSED|nr:hypothetical protein [Pseudomonas lini]RON25623.1 hypothetical protein BK663_19350 [Pseudomonas lini]